MTRESRVNVIFIVVLVLLLIPGFIFLMKKKLSDTSGRSNFMPEAAPYQIAYIQPLPAPPVKRVEPRAVRDWVRSIAAEHYDSPDFSTGRHADDDSPIVSDQFVTQLVVFQRQSVKDRDQTHSFGRIGLLRWVDYDLRGYLGTTVDVDYPHGTARNFLFHEERVDVPKDIRHALQDVGYVDPPKQCVWIETSVKLPDQHADTPTAIRLTTRMMVGQTAKDTIETIFLRPPATRPSIEVRP